MRKKIYIILIAFLLCGCSNNINLSISEPSKILYDDTELYISDFAEILGKTNNKTFYPLYDFHVKGNKLSIISNELTYEFDILDNYIIYHEGGNKYYLKSDNIKSYFENLKEKYTDNNIININIGDNYDNFNPDYIIKLDDSNNYLLITAKINLYNFLINEDLVSDIKNEILKIENGKTICIEKKDFQNLNITFDNPYGKTFNLIYNNGFKLELKKEDA